MIVDPYERLVSSPWAHVTDWVVIGDCLRPRPGRPSHVENSHLRTHDRKATSLQEALSHAPHTTVSLAEPGRLMLNHQVRETIRLLALREFSGGILNCVIAGTSLNLSDILDRAVLELVVRMLSDIPTEP
ncbi:hypothetical protein [uncultured Nocardioides sp.]|uniref:hypothetical protein n=1 Tax=uncultured Nocardioides sp. TaxID=198441 RepID=UPI00262C7992|nr:hypothetical protein [uncultured Nocardioides sp.]